MSIGNVFLGLLESQPRHGYELKRAYAERFIPQFGQLAPELSCRDNVALPRRLDGVGRRAADRRRGPARAGGAPCSPCPRCGA